MTQNTTVLDHWKQLFLQLNNVKTSTHWVIIQGNGTVVCFPKILDVLGLDIMPRDLWNDSLSFQYKISERVQTKVDFNTCWHSTKIKMTQKTTVLDHWKQLFLQLNNVKTSTHWVIIQGNGTVVCFPKILDVLGLDIMPRDLWSEFSVLSIQDIGNEFKQR
ncbi:hypothetical protein IV203_012604 [Nitzschia inconspicua]|uniref:Uncharacterized protein n=1 Tax=Nitzschia inconspicua TaxID=303405 RepID=A0A9K3PJG3_9STRA|nr:hypothetical protein IV203_012604 [Nitzschia inconspicua]